MKPNRQVMVILRSEIWYFSSKIQNLEHPITLSVNWLEIARILGKSIKSAPKSRKINFLHNILSFPVFREVLDSIYVVHKCVGCFYTIATNFGFLVYTTFLYKCLVPVTLTAGGAVKTLVLARWRSGWGCALINSHLEPSHAEVAVFFLQNFLIVRNCVDLNQELQNLVFC